MFIVIKKDLIINTNHFISALRCANGNLEIKMVNSVIFNLVNVTNSEYNDFIIALSGVSHE